MANALSIANSSIEARASQLNWVGAATSATSPQATWFYRDYVNASFYVFVKPDNTTTPVHWLIGDIRAHYKAIGGGFGYPTIDETTTPDGIGRYNFFSGGPAIYWTPSTGARAVYGLILAKWASMGYERSPLGYPTTDETSYGTHGGRYNDFQHGLINFSPATGAHEHVGSLPFSISLGNNFSFPSGTPVGGWTNVEFHSDGTFRYRGDFHDSGAFGESFSVANVVTDADNAAYKLSKSGSMGGTFTHGKRDFPWDTTAQNDAIRDNWRSIVSKMQVHGEATAKFDVGALFTALFEDIGTVVQVIDLIS